ncbi:hypothetical protein DH2020_004311 [Rehmannia glutinosa]|uniref:Pectinesterase catalytic domain-containing protein n=1 Tax=Rehmannia glutinosa TaxID=99300 RepID=A0ABR0XP28_REHGL
MDGYQDTLYAQTHRQFFRNCVISAPLISYSGRGSHPKLFDHSEEADGQSTEHGDSSGADARAGRRRDSNTELQNCSGTETGTSEVQDSDIFGTAMEDVLEDRDNGIDIGRFHSATRVDAVERDFALDTLYYREYANRGPGASTDNRVKWKGYGVITNRNEAMQFTAAQFIQANQWLTSTAVPFFLGLKN